MPTAPNTDNLTILKAIVSFDLNSTGSFRDLGEVPRFELTPEIERLKYNSSRQGIRVVTKSVDVTKALKFAFRMDELVAENMALGLGGTVFTDSDGNKSFGVMSAGDIEGTIKSVGTNSVGQKLTFVGQVTFSPAGTFGLITEEWAGLDVEGDVLADASGRFGIMTVEDQTSA